MHSLEYIDGYFKGEFSPGEKMEFERKLAADPQFADDVAFYISTRQVSRDLVKEEKKQKFKKIYEDFNKEAKIVPMRRVWSYAAAAAVVALVFFGWFMFMQPPTPTQLADQYIKEHLTELGPNMGRQDSLQTAIGLYNQSKWNESLDIFENLTKAKPTDNKALEYAGVSALRLGKYDQAIQFFSQLETLPLAYNPGKFYHALALMKRNGPNDAAEAKKYLQEVVSQGLEYKEFAPALLKAL